MPRSKRPAAAELPLDLPPPPPPVRGRWERRAERIIRDLRAADVVDPVLDAGHTDALRAAGLALDLAEASASAFNVRYSLAGWTQAMDHLRASPAKRLDDHGELGAGGLGNVFGDADDVEAALARRATMGDAEKP